MPHERRDELLYNPHDEHDACGVGFVADVSGRATHDIIQGALEALCNLTHRGAVDADGRTGDGAGLLTQLPLKFFRREAERLGKRPEDDLAVGMFFLPRDESAAARCRQITTQVSEGYGLTPLCWRQAPVDESALGAKALTTAPRIEQLLAARGRASKHEFETALYRVRREVEEQTSDIEGFYIPSFSSRTIVYKGLLTGSQLGLFYPDLSDPDFEASLAVFHQRYSTNTFPNWALAQPFRLLAHNGEINTISGNRSWMRARERASRTTQSSRDSSELRSVIWGKGSDSASLDNTLELSVMSGREVTESVMMLIPEAYEKSDEMSPELRGFYDYAASLTEPWDGPAAVAFTDGRIVGAALDRNGLRPARYAVTTDGRVVVASEAGVIQLSPDMVVQKGRLGPGQMIAVDTGLGILLTNGEVKRRVATQRPYADWAPRSSIQRPNLNDDRAGSIGDERALIRRMKSFGYTVEDVERILGPMLAEGKEPVGSMGDDTPLAILSSKPRLLYSYFKQRFAQVTNPAIDPIRERLVMSLTTLLGSRGDLTAEPPARAQLIKLSSPILSDAPLEWLSRQSGVGFRCSMLRAFFDIVKGGDGLKRAIDELCRRASEAVEAGCSILIISDLGAGESEAPIPMLLAVGAIHNHLIREGQRMRASLIAHTGEARDDHHIACLIGFGANAVCPSLGFDVIAHEGPRRGLTVSDALRNYRRALEDGLLKIMAKMGISTLAGYCGSQTFEIVGLDKHLVEEYFSGALCRLSGIGLDEIAGDALRFHEAACAQTEPALEDAGFFRYRYGGEYHSFNPAVFRALHRAARGSDPDEYARYAGEVLGRPPATLRDLIEFQPARPIELDEVEPAQRVLARFSTSGMSFGALSKKAHETLAIAMNRLGAKSNSGEGGEDSRRFKRRPGGDLANSKIKQVASARFGVTPEYLVSADELEIKIAQGSKPGEGGQLPGHKVSAEIAAIRRSVPGVTLISPPPHHDIYSIEDLAQLIFDLKQINPEARIAVKLVSEAGIGTIAAGVAKAGADVIHISGHDGGTGASPLGSIKNAGTPWELGLAETQQALVMNGLRARVRLRVDGGLKTGRDVIIAAMLGADEFGFATAAVVALGCVMARQCHMNTCPVGIATQDPALRRKFTGTPEMVVSFFRAMAEDIRQLLAAIGFRSLDQLVGRSDLLSQKTDLKLPRSASIDLGPLLRRVDGSGLTASRLIDAPARNSAGSLSNALEEACSEAIRDGSAIAAVFEIRNTDRAIGARIAGAIARRYGDAVLPDGTINLTFAGSAGQSFGAFNIAGLRLTLIGEANDYVGKGMSGGEIVIRPPDESYFEWSQNVIIGNTVMYGATGGRLFAAGRAGERFCVRNSGGVAVVEGVGDHGCEYMTAGVVAVLGEVGRNFAAGMTGGVAFVFDELGDFQTRCNRELVGLVRVAEHEFQTLRALVERHYEMTSSPRAHQLLSNWERARNLFWQVVTQAEAARQMKAELPHVSVAPAFERSIPLAVAD
jgi:glutamate synthase domain-containing protein 2/glutamate synthase domain-containing protein 1/glutamate synthase domain-containing protein 3